MEDYFHNLCENSSIRDTGTDLNATSPDITGCVQSTLLMWMPCGLFWLFLPNYISSLISRKDQPLPSSTYHISAKKFITWVLCVLTANELVMLYGLDEDVMFELKSASIPPVIRIATFIATLGIGMLERRKGIVSSGIIFLYWLSMVITAFVPIYMQLKHQDDGIHTLMSALIYWGLVVAQFILHCFAEKAPVNLEESNGKKPCPEVHASFLSKLSFQWMNSLIIGGYEKPITEDDIWDMRPQDKAKAVVPEFEELWNQEMEACKRYNDTKRELKSEQNKNKDTAEKTQEQEDKKKSNLKTPSLIKVIIKMCGKDVIRGIVIRIIFDILQLCNPILLGMLITFIETKTNEETWKGYVLACSFYLNAMVTFGLVYNNDINMDGLIMKLFTTLTTAIYKKSLKMDNETKKSSTVGELVNLASVDVGRIRTINWTFMFCVSVPIRFLICTYLLWNTIGSSIFVGMTAFIILMPVNYWVNKKMDILHKELMDIKDARSKLMSEIFNGIKVLKFYVWEPSFEQKVNDLREKETSVIKKIRYLDTTRILSFGCIPFLVTVISFAIYIFYQNGVFDAGTAFMTMSLFDNLVWPLFMLPHLLQGLSQAFVSAKRISEFLQGGELDSKNVQHKDIQDVAIKVENGTFTWDKNMEPTLKGINLEIPKGKLVAIVGQVGMGKSSLLSSFLGEMDKIHGRVNVTGTIGYVPQQAWIQNAKLRDNILFCKQMDQDKYDKVIKACSLTNDLEMLAAGDKTEIGEKGINLSGGQKQRVNLARAVYHDADIYLLDDPLSAVDSHVGKHIFEEVVGEYGLLKDKTRVLVTHGVHWLPKVDQIIVMRNGEISEIGTYSELLQNGKEFSEFLKTYSSAASDTSEDIADDDDFTVDSEIIDTTSEFFKENSMDDKRSQKNQSDLFDRLFHTLEDDDIPSSTSAMRRRQVHGQNLSGFKDELVQKTNEFEISMNENNNNETNKSEIEHVKISKQEKTLESKEKQEKDDGTLIEDEESETGQVKLSVFVKYFQAFGNWWFIILCLVAVLKEFFFLSNSVTLSYWTEDEIIKNHTLLNTTEYKYRNILYIAMYAGCGLVGHVFDVVYALIVFLRSIVASRQLHGAMLKNILRCPMSFFDTTPVARILNRFTSDIDTTDHSLPHHIRHVFLQLLNITVTLVVITYNTPLFITVIIPATFLYRLVQKYFVTSIRQLERLRSKKNSPMISHVGESISGVSTIRAYGKQDSFIKEHEKRLEMNVMCLYIVICAHKWLGLRLEAISYLFVFGTALFSVMTDDVSSGVVGLCMAFILQITGSLNGMVHNSVRLETSAIGIERIKEYTEKETEAALLSENKPSSSWPSSGNISIKKYQTRYRSGLDLVLKGIDCEIKGGERVGVVGRTGAGKSSLMSALFRLIEATDGRIEIDGRDISTIGLHDLRNKLTILPQEPVLFSGTLRMNLDPFDNFSDAELWTALEHAHLKDFVKGLSDGLKYECGEGGQNLSVGQRQLVCLARALLYKTKILILDEATAAVDMETDDLIQKTIRTEFKDCTVMAIAHRLNTIMDYDKVLVLGDGLVLEYDTPDNLLNNKQSVFYGMAKQSSLV